MRHPQKRLLTAATLCTLAMACNSFHLPDTMTASALQSNRVRDFDDVGLSLRPYDSHALLHLEDEITDSLTKATESEDVPSVVYAIGDREGLILTGAQGFARLEPGQPQPASLNTMYDLASLTKVIATTTAIMQLAERGQISLDDPIIDYLPDYANNGKEEITIRQCMTHTAGFKPFFRLWIELEDPSQVREFYANSALDWEPGTEYHYSDVGYVTLGWVVEAVTNMPLDSYCTRNIFQPLGMNDTTFNPDLPLWPHCAATEFDTQIRERVVQGQVHDENSFYMGGVAGHAGLFSTVGDLTHFAMALLNGGEFQGTRILTPESVAEMTRMQIDMVDGDGDTVRRGLGWWLRDGGGFLGSCGGEDFSPATFGHTGYTGTAIQMDPESGIFAIFLSNRVHARSDEWHDPDFRANSYRRFRPVRVHFYDTVAETFD